MSTQNSSCLYYYLLITVFFIQTTVNQLLPTPVFRDESSFHDLIKQKLNRIWYLYGTI